MEINSKAVLDQEVRRYIYDQIMKIGVSPAAAETATALSAPLADVQSSFQRLADAHMLVLQKDTDVALQVGRACGQMVARLAFAAWRNFFPRPMLAFSTGVVQSGSTRA